MSSRFERELLDSRVIRATAPAKVILHGEHSVVYGKTALACSLDIRTSATIRSSFNKRQIRVDFPDLGSTHLIPISKLKQVMDQVRAVDSAYCPSQVASISKILQAAFPESCDDTEFLVFLYLFTAMIAVESETGHLSPVEVSVTSDIPIGAGLGSSAAFSVSLAGAIFQFVKGKIVTSANGNGSLHLQDSNKDGGFQTIEENPDDTAAICRWAYNAEKIIHGNPSGLDNTICTYGGLLTYRKAVADQTRMKKNEKSAENFMESVTVPKNLRILLINTKVPKNTKALVAKVATDRFQLLPKVTSHILEAMDRVSQECKDTFCAIMNNSLTNNNNNRSTGKSVEEEEKLKALFFKLEQLIDINQGLLSALGVSHPTLEQVAAICQKKGELHAKLTGAGGGGFAFALVTPFHTEDQVAMVKNELQSQGFECWDTNIAGDGVQVEVSC